MREMFFCTNLHGYALGTAERDIDSNNTCESRNSISILMPLGVEANKL